MAAENHRWVLSGGLASGKSKVRELLADNGIVTVDADAIGHLVLQPSGAAFSEVAAKWPEVLRRGEIDRAALASIVFSDEDQLAVLESITHPHIFDIIRARVEGIQSPVVVEVPLLAHGMGEDWRRIVVDCHDEVRLQRALDRGMTKADAASRLAAQPTREEWLAMADLVVPNHGSLEDLEATVRRLSLTDVFNSHPV